jgi:ATP-binding cassette, subfamily B, multidrug efflux pump
MKTLISYLKKYKFSVILSLFLVSFSALTTLIIPKILENAINEGINAVGGPNKEIMQQYGLIMLAIAIGGLLCGIVNGFISARLSQNVGADMRYDGFKKIQDFSYTEIEKFKASNLVVRLTNDINQIQTVIMLMFTTLVRMPVIFVGAFILAITTLPALWYIIILLIVVVLIIMAIVMKSAFPFFAKTQKQIDRINSRVKENLEGVRVVKSFVGEAQEESKFIADNNKLVDFTKKVGYIFAIVMPIIMLIVNLLIALVIYQAKDLAVDDISVIGSIVSFIQYLNQLMMSLIFGGMVLMQFSRAFVSINRYKEIIDTKPSITYPKEGVTKLKGDVEFKHVSFTYPDDTYKSVKDISFKVKSGEKIGIVGATGAGKSTLMHLLLRLFDVQKGEILIDGINIKDIPEKTLRHDVSMVLQRPILFSGTIKNNLAYGMDVQDKVIQSAINDAQADEFIMKMENQVNSRVLQRGSNFSGGQKQRISIARALVGDPAILVLDDSTSALDAKSEKLVKEALYENHPKQTIFIIAQKITSVIEADKIIVMNEGKLDAMGTHKQLLKKSEIYKEIYETQKGK